MKVSRVQALILLLISLFLSACDGPKAKPPEQVRKVTVTTVQSKAVNLTQQYVCNIHSRHYIEVRVPAEGYLASIPVKEGQRVKRHDLLFQIKPGTDKKKQDAKSEDKLVAVSAPFDGMIGRLPRQQGSLVQKNETVTTLADDSLMRANFNVSEARYLEYKAANLDEHRGDLKIELLLANGDKFNQPGKLGAIGGEFKSGNVSFHVDFPNPEHLLRHGQTVTVLISKVQKDAIVVPQKAALDLLHKRYVYVVDKRNIVHQRDILIENESEGLLVIEKGVVVGEKIVLDGADMLRDGDKVKYEDR